MDLLGVWEIAFESYYIKHYMKKNVTLTGLANLEPWFYEKPWTKALQGKKVLVIHPFTETIISQYKKRKYLFADSSVLPKFNLLTLKAVQTIAGQNDERFNTWFDALDWMYMEAMKLDFDVALIGCGAYGFPLAAKLKESGKIAIHMGGSLQLLLGFEENVGMMTLKCKSLLMNTG